LHSCSTGKGPNSFAQQLAKDLNAPVIAPDDKVGVRWGTDENGNPFESSRVINGGHFWMFFPNAQPQMLGNAY